MTARAVILGLLGVAFISVFTYWNNSVMQQTALVGNNLPFSVYGSLILFVLLANPLLARIHARLAFSGRELAVALVLVLAACCIPGSGLMRTFPSSIVLPHHYARTEVGWSEQRVLEMAPENALVDVSEHDSSTVVNGFLQGLGVGTRHIDFLDVPWEAWAPALAAWLPLIVVLWVSLVGLSLLVHRQWADHEQLPYPIAQFADSLLPDERGGLSPVFRNRMFWCGALAMLVIHLNNYAVSWFPEYMVHIPLQFNFWSLSQTFETVREGGGRFLFSPTLYPTVIAFSFFLAAEVSLSLGIGPIVYVYLSGLLLGAGISLGGGDYLGLKPQTFLNAGAYLGLLFAMMYTGRFFYFNALCRALGMRGAREVGLVPTWGMRIFLLGFLAFVLCAENLGIAWPLAILYGLGVVAIFVVMARIMAETGLFFMQAYTFPCVVIWGTFGSHALGPEALLGLLLLTTVLLVDPREALMPFIVTSLKLVDIRKVPIGKAGVGFMAALLLGLGLAVPVQLYIQYDRGADMSDRWANGVVPKLPFEQAARVKQRLDAQDALESSAAREGWERIAAISPDREMLLYLGVGLALVTVFTACRLRFPRWPLHPVMFLVWSTYPGKLFAISFLLGSAIKAAVTKYGGPAGYQKLKPLMFGVIAGELLGALLPSLFGAAYYLTTGEIPKSFKIFPG